MSPNEHRPILVVDDDEDIRGLHRELLEDEGFVVIDADNGRSALDIIEGGAEPSLVILDLNMPLMNGWEVLAAMARDARLRDIPVIVVSGQAESTTSLPKAVVAFMSKPIDLIGFVALVKRHAAAAQGETRWPSRRTL